MWENQVELTVNPVYILITWLQNDIIILKIFLETFTVFLKITVYIGEELLRLRQRRCAMETRQKDTVLSDEEIIGLYFERQESAISETDNKYGRYLYTIAFNILNNNEDSEECLNDTYLKTWNAIPPANPGILRAFLAKIMRTTALDRYDAMKRRKRIPPDMRTSLSELEGLISDTSDDSPEEIGRIITEYLDGISDRRMYIFMSRYFFVKSIREISEKLGCSESTVNKELSHIRKELRDKLVKEGIEV